MIYSPEFSTGGLWLSFSWDRLTEQSHYSALNFTFQYDYITSETFFLFYNRGLQDTFPQFNTLSGMANPASSV